MISIFTDIIWVWFSMDKEVAGESASKITEMSIKDNEETILHN